MNHPIRITALTLLLVVGLSTFGCLDFTPLTATPAPAAEVEAGSVATIPSVADVAASPCFQCVTGATDSGASCKSEYAVCDASAKCAGLFRCGIPRACYRPGENLIACLSACGSAAGLTGMDDPAVGDFLRLYNCATTTCAPSCSLPATPGG